MRFPAFSSLLLLGALLLPGCAYEGVIVRKESRPHPLYHSIGVEGMYAFLLRDKAGAVHRQMVTPEVFERYVEGEYFNDLQPSTRNDNYDGKTMRSTVQPPAPYIPRPVARNMKATKRQFVLSSQSQQGKTQQSARGLIVATASATRKTLPAASRTIVSAKPAAASAATPLLPMMERSAPDEREIVFMPTRVR